jgi:hypothetical protein
MALVPHQGLGSRTAAPNFKNCRTVETMSRPRQGLGKAYARVCQGFDKDDAVQHLLTYMHVF